MFKYLEHYQLAKQGGGFTPEHAERLRQVEARLDAALLRMGGPGAFVRLSRRSPKVESLIETLADVDE